MAIAVTPRRAPHVGGVRAALSVALAGSVGAGLVHAAAARNHDGDRLLVVLFALCAVAQLGWAVAATLKPSTRVLVAGLVINGGALLVWALTRTVGVPFIESLGAAESVGTPDLGGALFAAISVLGVATVLLRPVPRTVLHPAGVAALAAFALVAALPAMAAGHTHEHSGDVHLDAAGHGDDEAAHAAGGDLAAGDEHAAGADHADEADHAAAGHTTDAAAEGDHGDHAASGGDLVAHDDHPTDPAAPSDGHDGHTDPGPHPPTTDGPPHHPPAPTPGPTVPGPTGPIISLDDPRVTPEQRVIAANLISTTTTGMAGFTTVQQVIAAGYTSIGDGGVDGYEHFVNWSYLTDSYELDPTRIESIVVKKDPGGSKTIVSAMYILKLGKTLANVPTLAGPLTTWHDHQNLCFSGTTLVGLAVNGVCSTGTLLPTPPMLHVWLVPHPCGPFAGIETHGGGTCGGHDGH